MDTDYLVVTNIKNIFTRLENLGTIKNMKMFLKIDEIDENLVMVRTDRFTVPGSQIGSLLATIAFFSTSVYILIILDYSFYDEMMKVLRYVPWNEQL